MENRLKSGNSIRNTTQNVVEKPNPHKKKNWRRRSEPTPASLFAMINNISHLSRTVKTVRYQ